MEDDPLQPGFGNVEEEDDNEPSSEKQQDELPRLLRNCYEAGHLTDPAGIVCCAEQNGQVTRQLFIESISRLNGEEFDLFCIRLIQRQAFHQSITGCAGTENDEYIPDALRKDFVVKKRIDRGVPTLEESIHNMNSPGIIAQRCKTPKGYSPDPFIEAVKNMSESDFQSMCGNIKWFSWQMDSLSEKLYTNKPFAIPPKLRSHFWINGIDEEQFFVYEPFPDLPRDFFTEHSRSVDDFIAGTKGLSQDEFDAHCKRIIRSHYFVYKVSGMVGTDLAERIPRGLKEQFSKLEVDEKELPQLEPLDVTGLLLSTEPGMFFGDCDRGGHYGKNDLIRKVKSMTPARFEKFAHQCRLLLHLYSSFKDYLFTCAYYAIPKELRMYFRYFDIRERVFTQRLDEYFGDIEPQNGGS